jgi:predicted nucleic acid-binding protein
MRFVLDCSITMSWFLEDEATPFTDKLHEILSLDSDAVVPSIWINEVVNVFIIAERKKRIAPEKTNRFLSLLFLLPIYKEEVPSSFIINDILLLARKHNLSSYDAAYLELAVRERIPLATLDHDLLKAARKENLICLDESSHP